MVWNLRSFCLGQQGIRAVRPITAEADRVSTDPLQLPEAPATVSPKTFLAEPWATLKSFRGMLLAKLRPLGMLAVASLISACVGFAGGPATPHLRAGEPGASCTVTGELRSWVVAANGRHLRLDLNGGCGTKRQSVEYADMKPFAEKDGIYSIISPAPEYRIRSPFGREPSARLEASYSFDAKVAECLSEPRWYAGPYHILGPNSSSGLRAAFEACGVPMPAPILDKGSSIEEFPGIEDSPGPRIW